MAKLLPQTIKHTLSTHKRTEYDSKRHILTAYFKDGSIYQFMDVPQKIFDDLKAIEDTQGKYESLDDNDVISDYFFGHLWEKLTMKRRGNSRWFDKKMRFYYIKVKSPSNSTHGLEAYK